METSGLLAAAVPAPPGGLVRGKPNRRSSLGTILASSLLFLLFMEIFAFRQLGDTRDGADFRSFYAAGYIVRTHPSLLYVLPEQARVQNTLISRSDFPLPYFHPPFEALVYAPFTLLPYRAAYGLFLLFNAGLLAAVVLATPELTGARLPLPGRIPCLALFLFAPVLVAVLQGQDSILYLLLCSVAFRLFANKSDALAGGVLALMLFRFQLTLPLLAILLLRRRYGLLRGFLPVALLLVVVSVLLVGSSGTAALAQLLGSGSLSHDHGLHMQDLMAIHPLAMPNLFGLLYACGVQLLPPVRATACVLAASFALFGFTAWAARRVASDAALFALALTCSILVSYHMYLHDLSLLVLPLALLRTRAAWLVALVTYPAALGVLLFGGAGTFFLLAVPVLCLLCFGWQQLSAPESRPADAVLHAG